jgi:hypothetical protein
MAQTPKKQRVQIKVFDVDSGQELSSQETTIPVNGNGIIRSCCSSCSNSIPVFTTPTTPTKV